MSKNHLCQHENTTCRDSRPYGVKKTPFAYLRYRRHKCLDCGTFFSTYEMRQEDLDAYEGVKLSILAKEEKEEILRDVKHTLFADKIEFSVLADPLAGRKNPASFSVEVA